MIFSYQWRSRQLLWVKCKGKDVTIPPTLFDLQVISGKSRAKTLNRRPSNLFAIPLAKTTLTHFTVTAAWRKGYPVIQPHPFLSDGSVYNSSTQLRNSSEKSTGCWTSWGAIFLLFLTSDFVAGSCGSCLQRGRWDCRKQSSGYKSLAGFQREDKRLIGLRMFTQTCTVCQCCFQVKASIV